MIHSIFHQSTEHNNIEWEKARKKSCSTKLTKATQHRNIKETLRKFLEKLNEDDNERRQPRTTAREIVMISILCRFKLNKINYKKIGTMNENINKRRK